MGVIRVKNIKLYANHGCMVEEGKIGSDYIVNVKLKTNLDASILSDNLEDTVDYVAVYNIVKAEMSVRAKLLEVVVHKIIERVLEEHPTVQMVRVRVAKKKSSNWWRSRRSKCRKKREKKKGIKNILFTTFAGLASWPSG